MRKFLVELEGALARMTPEQAQATGQTYLALIRGVQSTTRVVGPLFRPSKMAVLGLMSDLAGAMGPGGGEKLILKLRKEASRAGSRVTALVQAL